MIYCWDSWVGFCVSDHSLDAIKRMIGHGKHEYKVARFECAGGKTSCFCWRMGYEDNKRSRHNHGDNRISTF